MTANQTIDGVPRDLLQKIADGGYCHQGLMDRLRALLDAEQPAPVAVVLPERREIGPNYPYLSDLDIEWNACLDELKRLNTARPAHANPPPGTEPCGTHHDNDGLDEWRKPK